MKNFNKFSLFIIGLPIALLFAGCTISSSNNQIQPTNNLENSSTATLESVAIPEDTQIPAPEMAAIVNEIGIPMASFEASFTQISIALIDFPNIVGNGETAKQKVIKDLIYRQLLAQAAIEAGYEVTPENLLEKLNYITEEIGGEELLLAWIAENGYESKADLLYDLSVEMAATFQRNRIFDSVPIETEQTHAHQLFFSDAYLATRAHGQLVAGTNWETVLANNDPFDYGYLGWFPRGYLLFPELNQIAFSLLPGAFSDVIETEIGFHILYIIERSDNVLLSPDAYLSLKNNALTNWVGAEYQTANIELLILDK